MLGLTAARVYDFDVSRSADWRRGSGRHATSVHGSALVATS